MRRLPPNKVEQNLNGLLNLIPEETEELLQRVDQPLKEATDPETVGFIPMCLNPAAFYFAFTVGTKVPSLRLQPRWRFLQV